jgi:LPXTG-site transpeptidase (sortase) family protein
MSKRLTLFSDQKAIGTLLIIIGIILGCLAIGLYINNRHNEPKPPTGAETSRAAPSSVKPNPQVVTDYTVPSTDPKYVTIPAINVSEARVIELGLTKAGQIAVPDNIYDTGWYDGSSKPGQAGVMFLYGHVSSWTANGVFYNLKKLRPGDDINVIRGDNRVYEYQVVSSKVYQYNNVDMNQILAPINPNRPGLNLMTCTGQVIKGTSEFNERLVVFASLITT